MTNKEINIKDKSENNLSNIQWKHSTSGWEALTDDIYLIDKLNQISTYASNKYSQIYNAVLQPSSGLDGPSVGCFCFIATPIYYGGIIICYNQNYFYKFRYSNGTYSISKF